MTTQAATVAELTEDGRAALDYLETRDDVDQGRLGLLGHSEGGLYAATLGAEDPRVAFVVGMAAPAVGGVQLLVDQNEAIARTSGLSDEAARCHDPALRAGVSGCSRWRCGRRPRSSLRLAGGAYWDGQPEDVRTVLGDRDAFIERQVESQLPTLMSDWFRSVLASDPAADWGRVTVPVLALFGGLDVQVPRRAERGRTPRRARVRPATTTSRSSTIPDANHLFQAAETGALEEYGRLADTFSADVLPTLVDWVTERAGRHRGGAIARSVSDPDFAWHPEPERVDVRDAAASRASLEALGEETWSVALDYLYEHGFERAVGGPSRYEDMRRLYFGPSGEPAPAPADPTPMAALLDGVPRAARPRTS